MTCTECVLSSNAFAVTASARLLSPEYAEGVGEVPGVWEVLKRSVQSLPEGCFLAIHHEGPGADRQGGAYLVVSDGLWQHEYDVQSVDDDEYEGDSEHGARAHSGVNIATHGRSNGE